jgi:hypothetical protein
MSTPHEYEAVLTPDAEGGFSASVPAPLVAHGDRVLLDGARTIAF